MSNHFYHMGFDFISVLLAFKRQKNPKFQQYFLRLNEMSPQKKLSLKHLRHLMQTHDKLFNLEIIKIISFANSYFEKSKVCTGIVFLTLYIYHWSIKTISTSLCCVDYLCLCTCG